MAAAPGLNVLVADLDEQSKHLCDLCLPFQEIAGGGTVLLADSHGENADISQRKDVFIGYIVSHVERRAAVKPTHVLQQRRFSRQGEETLPVRRAATTGSRASNGSR